MSPRTGRPKKEVVKENRVEIRLDKEELELLDFCCSKLSKSRSEILRMGINKIYISLHK